MTPLAVLKWWLVTASTDVGEFKKKASSNPEGGGVEELLRNNDPTASKVFPQPFEGAQGALSR